MYAGAVEKVRHQVGITRCRLTQLRERLLDGGRVAAGAHALHAVDLLALQRRVDVEQLELALAADFRVAGERARVGQPEILLGVIPGAGGTQRLSRLVGPARAKDIVFSGRMVGAAEALQIGLVDQVVPDDSVYQAALDMVRRYASGPALALRAAKQAIDSGLGVDLATGLEIERVQFAALFGTEDQKVGMRSFLENGPGKAAFTGR